MTLQTANHLPPPELVYGFPFSIFSMRGKILWYLKYYDERVCTENNSPLRHNKGDIYLVPLSYFVNSKTIEVSIDNGENWKKWKPEIFVKNINKYK